MERNNTLFAVVVVFAGVFCVAETAQAMSHDIELVFGNNGMIGYISLVIFLLPLFLRTDVCSTQISIREKFSNLSLGSMTVPLISRSRDSAKIKMAIPMYSLVHITDRSTPAVRSAKSSIFVPQGCRAM